MALWEVSRYEISLAIFISTLNSKKIAIHIKSLPFELNEKENAQDIISMQVNVIVATN